MEIKIIKSVLVALAKRTKISGEFNPLKIIEFSLKKKL
jgi:hypothetical protein